MKIAMFCTRCINAVPAEERTLKTEGEAPRRIGDVLEGGVVHATCAKGHAVTYVLNEPLFDLMFDMAALAFLDGYYRETVLGLTTALEGRRSSSRTLGAFGERFPLPRRSNS
jgi:hypothetical protein